MTFKTEIINAIKLATETYGTANTIRTLGNNGAAWNKLNNKYQYMEIISEAYANEVPIKSISMFKPYNGIMVKNLNSFISPNIIVFNEAYGLYIGDKFNVTGATQSANNVSNVEILNINGGTITIDINTLINESSTDAQASILAPENKLDIETTINKVQASIYSNLPKVATSIVFGLIKMATSISKFPISTTNVNELKFNELIDALRSSGIMETVDNQL